MCFSLLIILLDCYQVTEALKGQDRAEARTNKFYRVDTAASTRPMLGEFQVLRSLCSAQGQLHGGENLPVNAGQLQFDHPMALMI